MVVKAPAVPSARVDNAVRPAPVIGKFKVVGIAGLANEPVKPRLPPAKSVKRVDGAARVFTLVTLNVFTTLALVTVPVVVVNLKLALLITEPVGIEDKLKREKPRTPVVVVAAFTPDIEGVVIVEAAVLDILPVQFAAFVGLRVTVVCAKLPKPTIIIASSNK